MAGCPPARLPAYLPLFAATNEKFYKQRKCTCFQIAVAVNSFKVHKKIRNSNEYSLKK
jgi:hypothetical protein